MQFIAVGRERAPKTRSGAPDSNTLWQIAVALSMFSASVCEMMLL
jgi:hypothetical protein